MVAPQPGYGDLITLKTIRHCSRGSPSTTPIAIVGGDFNATWADHHGPLKSLGGWASAASLLSPIAQASSEGPSPLFSYYHGVTPTSLIDHILLSSSCQGQIAFAGVGCGALFGSISDHRPVLLGLCLNNGTPSLHLGRQASNAPPRAIDLDLTQPVLVDAYRAHTTALLSSLPTTASQEEAASALQSLCLDSAAWLQKQGGRKASKSSGRRHYDGWSPPAMALTAQLVALTLIQGHLHGHRGHARWHNQEDMDRDLPGIAARWETAVRGLSWPSPADSDYWLSCTGFPPTYWRTAFFDTVRRPGFGATLLRKVKHRLHGRFRVDLRRQISAATCQRESLREQGKLKPLSSRRTQTSTLSIVCKWSEDF